MYQTIDELLNDLYGRVAPKSDSKRIENCLAELNNPELQIKSIHIAGTNGKGSTTNYVAHILMNANYRVGTFTSPHLIVHNDRIRINNQNISDEDLLLYANKYMPYFDKYGLNMFEIDFVLAIMYFIDQKVDIAVFETGMGGRLDATNELKPLVNAITNIGMDHMQFLGDNLTKIAYEKAGIMKANTVCISTERKKECIEVFKDSANKVNAVLRLVEPLAVMSYPNLVLKYNDLTLELGDVAMYQRYNAALALGIIEELKVQGLKISDEAIIEGFKNKWAGRFERVSEKPLVYIDGAHNEEGIEALVESIKAFNKDTYILFAALSDKPVDDMLGALKDVSKEVCVTTFANKRQRNKDDYPSEYLFIDDYQKAIEYIMRKDGLIVITGSLYFISLVKEYFKENKKQENKEIAR